MDISRDNSLVVTAVCIYELHLFITCMYMYLYIFTHTLYTLYVHQGDDGKVHLFNHPCVTKNAPARVHGGHSSFVTCVKFLHDHDSATPIMVASSGGDDGKKTIKIKIKIKIKELICPVHQ